jgi:hypothetical protein
MTTIIETKRLILRTWNKECIFSAPITNLKTGFAKTQ